VQQPIVKGHVSADQGTFKAKITVSYGEQLQSAIDMALSVDAGKDANKASGGCCSIL
jgi:hypothetical protein